jgi:hypothetical protein
MKNTMGKNTVTLVTTFLLTLAIFINASQALSSLSAPMLTKPIQNALNCTFPVSLNWSNPPGAVSFTLQIATDSNFTTIIENRSGIVKPVFTPTGLLGSTKFFWRVKALNKRALESSWSSVANFTTAATDYRRAAGGMYNVMKYNSIRIAYYGNGEKLANGEVDPFLKKAKDTKYNYVLAEFTMDRGRNSSLLTKTEDFKLAFTRANAFGLRLIPLIQMGSGWAIHWRHAQSAWNQNIKMTRVTCSMTTTENGTVTTTKSPFGTPSFSYDPDGFDKTAIELFQAIRRAHQESGVSYPLEFIHLGHDEPAYYTRTLFGNCKTGDGPAGSGWSIVSVDEVCNADTSFIQHFAGSKSEAVQQLIVSELHRRIEQVNATMGNNVRIMVYGDIWDPQMNGKRNMELWDGTIIHTIPGIATLPGLTSLQKEQMRKKLIILPWNYDISCDFDGDGEYKANVTFNYLSSNGLKFVYAHEITANDIFPYSKDRIAQSNAYYKSAKKHRQNCLGYAAVHWTDWANPVPKSFDSMWYLYNLNASDVPLTDFNNN